MNGDFSFFEWFNAFVERGQRDLSGPAVKVAVAIARHADGSTGIAEPGQRRISDLAGDQNLGRIRKALAEVVKSGWILIINKGGGRLNTAQYQLAIPSIETGTTNVPESSQQTGTDTVPDSIETGMHAVPVYDAKTGTQDVPVSANMGTEVVPDSAQDEMREPAENGDVIEHKRGRKMRKRGTYVVPGRAYKGFRRAKYCGEPSAQLSADESPVALSFPVVGKGPGEWLLRESKIAEYVESFPGVDVLAECRKARQWCIDNRPKRKTADGMPRFLCTWLGKAQNDAARLAVRTAPSATMADNQRWDDIPNSQLPPELQRKRMPKEFHYELALELSPTRPDEQFLNDHPEIAAKGVPLPEMQAAWDEAFAWKQRQAAQRPAEVGV